MWRKCFKVVAGIEYRERERERERERRMKINRVRRKKFFFLGDMKPQKFFL